MVFSLVRLGVPSALVLSVAGTLVGRVLVKSRILSLFIMSGVICSFGWIHSLLAFRGFTSFPRLAKYSILTLRVRMLTGRSFVARVVLMSSRRLRPPVIRVIKGRLAVRLAIPDVLAMMTVSAPGWISRLNRLHCRIVWLLIFIKSSRIFRLCRWQRGCSIEPRL